MKRILKPLIIILTAATAPVLYYFAVLLFTERRMPVAEIALLCGIVLAGHTRFAVYWKGGAR
jgi:hypothetical protein